MATTTAIKKLDRTALTHLREPIEAELKALGERLGLSFALGNGTFGDGAEASYKLIIRVEDAETKLAAAQAEWDRHCRYVGIDYARPDETGLRPEDFNTVFEHLGSTYRAVAVNTGRKATKYPIKVEVVKDGRGTYAPGTRLTYGEVAVPLIRAATDAAKAATAAAPAAPARKRKVA